MKQPASLQELVEATSTLPSPPSILAKIHALTLDNAAGAHELEELILLDPALAATVLRIANSGFFSRAQRCDSIREAILRLGTSTLYQLAAAALAGRWLNHPIEGYGWRAGDLWRHSLCVAVTAEILARSTLLANPNICYTAGLLHDVGKLAIAYASGEAIDEIAKMVPERYSSWRDAEMEYLGYTSSDVTTLMLKAWGFSGALVSTGSYHMEPSRAPEEHKPLVTVIHAAELLATELGFGIGIDGFFCEVDEHALKVCNLTDDALHAEIPLILERLQRLVDSKGNLRAVA